MFYRIGETDRVVNLAQAVEIYVAVNDFNAVKYEVIANYSIDGRRANNMKCIFSGRPDQCSLEFERIVELLWKNDLLIESD